MQKYKQKNRCRFREKHLQAVCGWLQFWGKGATRMKCILFSASWSLRQAGGPWIIIINTMFTQISNPLSNSDITPASQTSLKHLKYHLKFELNTPKLRYVPCCDIYSFGFTRTGLIAFLHSLWLWQCLNKQTHPHFCHQLFLFLQVSTGKQKIKYTTPNIRYTMPNLAEQST